MNAALIISTCASNGTNGRGYYEPMMPVYSLRHEFYRFYVPVVKVFIFPSHETLYKDYNGLFKIKKYPELTGRAYKKYYIMTNHQDSIEQKAIEMANKDIIFWDGVKRNFMLDRYKQIGLYQEPEIETQVIIDMDVHI